MKSDESKPNNAGVRLVITGRVQMVGFRWFTVQWGRDLNLTGFARNESDGSVLVEAEGAKGDLESLIREVKKGPPASSVDRVEVEWLPFEHRFRDFEIRY
jgi:acylphosphatase